LLKKEIFGGASKIPQALVDFIDFYFSKIF